MTFGFQRKGNVDKCKIVANFLNTKGNQCVPINSSHFSKALTNEFVFLLTLGALVSRKKSDVFNDQIE
ncbi:hypothetical protein ACTXT7_006087 [Hymenolepis weldensis]